MEKLLETNHLIIPSNDFKFYKFLMDIPEFVFSNWLNAQYIEPIRSKAEDIKSETIFEQALSKFEHTLNELYAEVAILVYDAKKEME